MEHWRTGRSVFEWVKQNYSSIREKQSTPSNWNKWLGEVPRTSTTELTEKNRAVTTLNELKLLINDSQSHRVFWFTVTPIASLAVTRIFFDFAGRSIPIVSTVFATVDPLSISPLGQVAQLGSSLLLMMSIKGLGSHETSKRGNLLGISGVATAVLTVILSNWTNRAGISSSFFWFLPVAALGQYLGITVAKSVQMEQLPELVAGFHSLTGLAAVLVGIAGELGHGSDASIGRMIETFLGIAVGAATFSGSVAAAAKLNGIISGGPIGLDSRLLVNVASMAGLALTFTAYVLTASPGWRIASLVGDALVSLALGTMLVLPVGGSDIPIVISFLNAMSGIATSATGFSMDNSLLVMTGALVASSGTILSDIMCKGINRSLISVLSGGFGVDTNNMSADSQIAGGSSSVNEITTFSVQQLISKLQQAKKVLIIPGYGMAVARCQAGVAEMYSELTKRGIEVVFGIHPVAGRLPGHMNVILSEADIPYDVMQEMEEVNAEMESFDVAIVLGANDIVNPATASDPSSPIFGMPAIECWRAKQVVVMKRGMNTGYSGVDNPLFYLGNTAMLFGDAKSTVDQVHVAIVDSAIEEWPLAGDDSQDRMKSDSLEGRLNEEEKLLSKVSFEGLWIHKSVGALVSDREKRLPLSPKICLKLRQIGFEVLIPAGFGTSCGWSDTHFEKFGARILQSETEVLQQSDVLLKISPLSEDQLRIARPPEETEKKQILITAFPITGGPETAAKEDAVLSRLLSISNYPLTVFNLNLVPRISRAQSMDILSSMANIAGYKATINAFYRIGRLSRSSVTAGGTIPAAKVFVIGCGVAGLSAIATAHALGATVFATDVRPATKEQVESIGAKFVEVPSDESIVERGGYAGEVSASFAERQKALYRDVAASADVVITTAMVPGKKSPVLLSTEMVRLMKPGSIIVDMAAASGGNCELTVPDEIIEDDESKVIIDGNTNYANELPQLAAELFSQNVLAFIENLCSKKNDVSTMSIDTNDVIVRQSIVMLDGACMYPPPPLPASAPPALVKQVLKVPVDSSRMIQQPSPFGNSQDVLLILGAGALGGLGLAADHRTIRLVGDFVLSCVIGHFTVSSVTPALHTPLISVTNAVSGIIVVGGMLEIDPSFSGKSACALVAVLASLVNVSGGFAITDRMLSLFKPAVSSRK
jgi:NAD(P) transhydrogenase